MATVWKYPFDLDKLFTLKMPVGARILHLATQGGRPCLWALVDPDAPQEARYFTVMGTGYDVVAPHGKRVEYVGTFLQDDGDYVGHLFEIEADG